MKIAKGLKLTDLTVGIGKEVTPKSIIHYHCRCTLKNGDLIFDSRENYMYQSRAGNREAYVALDQGLIGMKVGGKRKIKVPPNLTYYERKVYPQLSDKTVIYYEVELHDVVDQWDNTLHIRTSPIISSETKALEKRVRELEPSTDYKSEFQRVQQKLFKAAEKETKKDRTSGST